MNRSSQTHARGVTLLELVIGMAIALLLTTAAITFSSHEIRLMGHSNRQMEMQQTGRAALDLMIADLSGAGEGLQYTTNGRLNGVDAPGRFPGLLLGAFTAGTLAFNANGEAEAPTGSLALGSGTDLVLTTTDNEGHAVGVGVDKLEVQTRDIGVVMAAGDYASVADYRITGAVGGGQFCVSPLGVGAMQFKSGELVVLSDANSLSAMAVELIVADPIVKAGACLGGRCRHGCADFGFSALEDDDPASFTTDSGVLRTNFKGGEIRGGYRTIAWFVSEENNVGILRRADFDGSMDCAARAGCGGVVADYVDALFAQAWMWNTATGQWVAAGQAPITDSSQRVRVDIELVVRARVPGNRRQSQVVVHVASGGDRCMPDFNNVPCPDPARADWFPRQVYRTSVEIKNSGLLATR